MVGICFGHQILAEALGGKVEKNPSGWEVRNKILCFAFLYYLRKKERSRKVTNKFSSKITPSTFTNETFLLPSLKASVVEFELTGDACELFGDSERRSLRMQYIHQDHVAVLPPGAKNMGKGRREEARIAKKVKEKQETEEEGEA